MSKTAKNGGNCRAGLGEGIRGVWPAAKLPKERPQTPKVPWVAFCNWPEANLPPGLTR